MKQKLAKLEQVELRKIWKHEATDFTTWLALPENIESLGDVVNIEFDTDSIETEKNTGSFSIDIYLEESNTGKKVIIENQLEKTDHDHLGKLITYASGVNAEVIIWIVKEVREEHQKAIDWLNDKTPEEVSFFAIKMEVLKIGNSMPASNFHVISEPNNWSKSVKKTISSKITPTKQLQMDFWDYFKNYCTEHSINAQMRNRLRKSKPQHWFDMSIGRSDCHMALTLHSQKKEIATEIYIPNSKETFFDFYKDKDSIEKKLGKLEWLELPEKTASRIKKSSKLDFTKESNWLKIAQWFTKTTIDFQNTFNDTSKSSEFRS